MNNKTIRQEAVTRIVAANTAAGSKVYNSKITPHLLGDLPAVSVYTSAGSAEQIASNNPYFIRTVDLQVEVHVAATITASDTMDDIVNDIKNALFGDSTWLALYTNVEGYTEQYVFDFDGEKPLAQAIITIGIEINEPINAGL